MAWLLGDSIKEEPILEERKDSIHDDLVQKVEALKVEGMDDRVSLDSDDERGTTRDTPPTLPLGTYPHLVT